MCVCIGLETYNLVIPIEQLQSEMLTAASVETHYGSNVKRRTAIK